MNRRFAAKENRNSEAWSLYAVFIPGRAIQRRLNAAVIILLQEMSEWGQVNCLGNEAGLQYAFEVASVAPKPTQLTCPYL